MDFDQAFDRLIGHEGGYVADLRDPGGETKFGISKRSYPNEDIANLTIERAKEIYKRDFWDALVGAPEAVKFQVFDFAVNSGIQTAIRKLQSAVGAADDGHWGPVSASKMAAMEMNDVLLRFLALRLEFMSSLKAFDSFGRGWTRRIARNLMLASEDN